jgi:hypothetical protein
VESLEPVFDGTVTVAVADKGFFEGLGSRINPLVGIFVILATLAGGLGGLIAIRDHYKRKADEPT